MANLTHIEIVDGTWVNGKIEPETVVDKRTKETTTTIILKLDSRDIDELTINNIDEYIAELEFTKTKMIAMDLEVNPPEVEEPVIEEPIPDVPTDSETVGEETPDIEDTVPDDEVEDTVETPEEPTTEIETPVEP